MYPKTLVEFFDIISGIRNLRHETWL